jgi:GrpB-like predicted nucleotidyltransferase (UPF0157 family)/N-acetylglutamate synthase-like GNAT family acetyltransferase
MFYDMEEQLDNPVVLQIMAYGEYQCSIERAKQRAAEYRLHKSWHLCGWIEDGEIVGVCGFEVHSDHVELLIISVAENIRHRGVGRNMITALANKYEMTIQAETDDDAVGFYRKCGFEAFAIPQYDVRRWTCILTLPKPPERETDKERQARIYPIILKKYNTAWAEWFIEEKINLERLIGRESIARISHFGSTSVPGLAAKPTIDILLEIPEDTNVNKLIDSLSSPEYICLNPPDMPTPPPHLVFLKGYTPTGFAEKVYHIHVRYPNDWDELYFRDYLIAHPETAAEYAALKRRLYKDFEHDRDGYTEAKTSFVKSITEKAKEELNVLN